MRQPFSFYFRRLNEKLRIFIMLGRSWPSAGPRGWFLMENSNNGGGGGTFWREVLYLSLALHLKKKKFSQLLILCFPALDNCNLSGQRKPVGVAPADITWIASQKQLEICWTVYSSLRVCILRCLEANKREK